MNTKLYEKIYNKLQLPPPNNGHYLRMKVSINGQYKKT